MKISPKMMPKMSGVQRFFVTFKKKGLLSKRCLEQKSVSFGKVTYSKDFKM
jgi:hypothetical protein